MSTWIYLTDLAPSATIMNLETGKLRSVMQAAIKDKAPSGLRRGLLEESSGGLFVETGEFAPMSDDLLSDLEDSYKAPNGWNYDWPHYQVEVEGDTVPGFREKIAERLTAMMSVHPFEFQITGLQRRYLMYYSDGSYQTQKKFASLIPAPDAPPYRRDGTLRRRYDFEWDSIMRDASVPYPKEKEQRYGGLRPCLYYGPAWVVRFQLDGQDPLLDRCRVYVDDEANFICSDWCQRHDYSSYSNGINLQTGIYTFDGWVVNACVSKAMSAGGFKPKGATIKREAVRELMKKSTVVTMPKFEDSFNNALVNVKKYAKPVVKAEPKPVVDAGPITADVLAEAQAAFEQVLAEQAQAAAEAIAAGTAPAVVEVPKRAGAMAHNGWTPLVMPNGKYGDIPQTVPNPIILYYQTVGDNVCFFNGGVFDGSFNYPVSIDVVDQSKTAVVRIAENGPHLYLGMVRDESDNDDAEVLNPGWWAYAAAYHYRDTVQAATNNVLLNQN